MRRNSPKRDTKPSEMRHQARFRTHRNETPSEIPNPGELRIPIRKELCHV
eukprot:CAMPEP_0168226768 /NCGR_PEP_ID=MMETSP0140_2-20121125/13620_1 /TAXON_ID=44445 /ORGANISM="Pseudo-nitzschia australis, Strain 10249 10 AB" /LENGTH=49 /DNA_ID= /DNA_START= /DNA_END= /DNA_ORIENTATION=